MESEGLFVKNYLGTVSAVPRPRTCPQMEGRPSSYLIRADIQKEAIHPLENGIVSHPKIFYEMRGNNTRESGGSGKESEIIRNRTAATFEEINTENDEEKEKKKERKWSLGGLFRRKSKKDGDDSSEESGEDGKSGFLSRKKTKRERRKLKGRSTANGFDVVIPQSQKDGGMTNGVGKTSEQLWTGSNVPEVNTVPEVHPSGQPIRFIHRHHNGHDAGNSLQVPKTSRRDSRSSGGSECQDGRKGRKEVMARAEAKRDMMRDDSSSDECDSYHSSSSLNRLNADGSLRRLRRADRKRMSRDEENQKEADVRLIKSDMEGGGRGRIPVNIRWTGRAFCPDVSDHEPAKVNLMSHSGTPSPCRSPRARQKHLLQYVSPVQNSYPTSTFPPGVHYQQSRNVVPSHFVPRRNVHAKDLIHGSQPVIGVHYRNHPHRGNRNTEYDLPRSLSVTDSSSNRKTLMDYEQFLSACGTSKERSLSYNQDIHRACYFENDPFEPSLPVPKGSNQTDCQSPRRTYKPEIYANEGRRSGMNYYNVPQQPFGGSHGSFENRTDSTPSLSTSGNFPHRPTQIVQRSASGNSFASESLKNFNQIRSSSYQHIPTFVSQARGHHLHQSSYPTNRSIADARNLQTSKSNDSSFRSQDEEPKSANSPKDIYGNIQGNQSPLASFTKPGAPSVLRYYADQNPRSRNPIHITCNPATSTEQPYLSDSQVVVKLVPNRSPNEVINASDFWKLKDQETRLKNSQTKAENHLKPPQIQAKSDRSRSSSPRLPNVTKNTINYKTGLEKPEKEVEKIINGSAKTPDRLKVENNRKVGKEETNLTKSGKTPPEPPVRRLSKQEVLARLQKCEQLKNWENELNKNARNEVKVSNSNLDEALNELEIIYNSLRLKDEDLVDRAERRDLPAYRPNTKEYNSISVRDKIQNFYAEAEFSHPRTETSELSHQRAIPLRRSGVPDKVADDMAFRRMNSKERTDARKFPSQSYLRSSPALSPVPGESPTFRRNESPVAEPDVTFDDVVFRNFRHANSTLKIQDPQPPFGIPIGVITPAPNSDYLHATPKDRFRPTFMSSKTPDVVKDDLAFRNLRKDGKTPGPVIDSVKSEIKKRAVRSLSANLSNIMQKDSPNTQMETNNNTIVGLESEKTQSLTDLTNGKEALEKRLKELKDEKNAKRAEFFELSQKMRKKENEGANLSWTELANLNGDYDNILDAANNNNNVQNKLRVNFQTEESSRTPEKKSLRSPVVELSKYPAAAPASSLQGNPFKEPSLTSPVDEDQLETLLSALAMEAKNASKDLERQLDELETKKPGEVKEKVKVVEDGKKPNPLDKIKRRRNLSLSNEYESKEEPFKTSSLERRKKRHHTCSVRRDETFEFLQKERKANEERERTNVGKVSREEFPERLPKGAETRPAEYRTAFRTEEKPCESDRTRGTASAERKQSATFELVTDLSQILHDVEVEQHLNEEISGEKSAKKPDVFQEVYEYNVKLTRRRSSAKEEESSPEVETNGDATVDAEEEKEDSNSDVEEEFEKIHEEVSTKDTKEDLEELLANVSSVSGSASDSYSSFPFPNLRRSAARDGTPSGSSNGQGVGHA